MKPTPTQPAARAARAGYSILTVIVTAAMTLIVMSPIALSSYDLLAWASAPTGLNLHQPWTILVVLSLDAAAIACIAISVLCTWRGEHPGIFAVLVWVFATGSAIANYRHSTHVGPPDRIWFIPAMSLTGPLLLEALQHRLRTWTHPHTTTTTARGAGSWMRWVPGIGCFTDTLGARRIQILTPEPLTFAAALNRYYQLCPTGSLRVGAAWRAHARTISTTPAQVVGRIPTDPDARARWEHIWADLQASTAGETSKALQARHQVSARQIQFIRAAGNAGLLGPTT